MLVALLSSQYARFTTLAQAWLSSGATSFGVYQQGRPLAYWPIGQKLAQPSLTVPIQVGSEVVGDVRVSGVHGQQHEARLRADADMIAYMVALENELQGMTAELVTSQDQQLSLYRLMQTMRSHVTIEETLQALVHEALRMVKIQSCFALFVAPDRDPLFVQHPTTTINEELAWRCYWHAQTMERELLLPNPDDTAWASLPVESLLFVPIHVRGTMMAGLGLVNRQGGEFFAVDLKLARAIADQVSAQIEKVLLYQESYDQAKLRTEMELARRVQLDLLPRHVPQVPGLDIYAHSRPAYQVGGDFFDFISEQGRPFIFSVGDVTGKGLSAALLMTMTRSALHSKALFIPDPNPEIVMRQSHEDLYHDFTQVGVFATAFVGQYERATQRLIYANAGHSPVIYRPRDGAPLLLRADSTAIGVFAVSHSKNQTIQMRQGDLLIVATDGFSDARNHSDETFDHERLLYMADRLVQKSAQEIGQALFDAVDRFSSGRPQDDDQTLVVIKGM
ncbi:MAG: SpoIIE family protein phosphatase [Chloroflexaceae bacterium]|jgi:sigma-B regulation protein RsbU (phosphoserine phosphatase)|nr:SpoIIE family protein phosphatase [Chloroflexaceae bacterium]